MTTQPAPPAAAAPMPTGYATIWDLFTDWCTVTDKTALPAHPDTVVAFLVECPCAAATQRRRVAAIDHHHTITGYPRPGESGAVRTATGRPTARSGQTIDTTTADAAQEALRQLPSHGWTRGMFGRRDRCLLVLTQLAGVPYKELAVLTAGDVTLIEGTATIRSEARAWVLLPGDGALLCGPCAVTRWLRILDLVVTQPSTRALVPALRKAKPVTGRSPHLCRSTRHLDVATLSVPLLPPIDQWGSVPFPVQRLTPHSLSRRARDLLDGDLGAHRDLPADTHDDTAPEAPAPVPTVRRGVYSRADSQRAWARRRSDLEDIAGVDDVLAEIDVRAKELERRTAALLASETEPARPCSRGPLINGPHCASAVPNVARLVQRVD